MLDRRARDEEAHGGGGDGYGVGQFEDEPLPEERVVAVEPEKAPAKRGGLGGFLSRAKTAGPSLRRAAKAGGATGAAGGEVESKSGQGAAGTDGGSRGKVKRARTLNKLKTNQDMLIEAVHEKVGAKPNRGEALDYDFDTLLAETEWREGDSDVDEDEELTRMMRGMEMMNQEAAVDPEAELAKLAFRDEYEYEGVDDEKFLESHYTAPDKFKAMKRAADNVFLKGNATIKFVGTQQLSQLGSGLALYFLWLQGMVYWGMFATLMVLPALYATYSGNRVSEDAMDPLFVSTFSLANLGASADAATLNATECSLSDCNSTKVDFGFVIMTDEFVSLTITAGDFLYSAAFIAFIVYFRRRIASLDDEIDKNTVTADDFAIYVTNLPVDAGADELEEHFSDLYQLEKPDWMFEGYCCKQIGYKKQRRPGHIMDRGRPESDVNGKKRLRYKARSYKPVLDTSFDGGKARHLRSWVCEVALAHPNGKMIRKFHQRKEKFQQLRAARAAVKKYDVRSRFADRFEKAKAKKTLDKVQKQWDKLSKQPVKITEEDVVAAFVIFNHEESYIHALHDYRRSTKCCGHWCQPAPLKFRNRMYPISVQKAPDPSNILWENLETTKCSRIARQLTSATITLILLVISFAVTLQSAVISAEVEAIVPDAGLCDVQLPNLLTQGEFEDGLALQRNATAQEDGTCRGDTVWVSYPNTHPHIDEIHNISCLKPCVDLSDDTVCSAPDGTQFRSRDILNCYCLSALTSALTEHGLFDGPDIVLNGPDSDLCSSFTDTYLEGQGIAIASSLVTVVINAIITKVIPVMSAWERHHTVTHQASSTAVKIFLAQFINTAIILVVVNARLPGEIGESVQIMGLFSGEFDGFTIGWYTTVGAPLVHTMLAQVVAPHVAPLLSVFVIKPLERWRLTERITTQYMMNELYKDDEFRIIESLASLLNILFCCLWFSAGMPIMIPILLIAFYITLKLQKYLLLRKAPKPPVYDKSLPLLVAELLPYAILGHLCLAVWMYGEPGVTISPDVQLQNYRIPGIFEPKQYYDTLLRLLRSGGDQLGTAERMVRQNTFPMALLVLVIVFGIAIFRMLGRLWKVLARRLLTVLSCGMWADDPSKLVSLIYQNREWNPPYSELFAKQLDPNEERVLTPQEVNEGWRIDTKEGQNILSRGWPDTDEIDGTKHFKGQPMRTWEVIQSKNLHTYDVMRNEKYKFAIAAMKATQLQQARKAALKAKGVEVDV